MNKTANAAWYKQAVCFMWWSRKDNEFGDKLACLLYAKQLSECEGNYPDPTLINSEKVLSNFKELHDDTEFGEEVSKKFMQGWYELVQDRLFSKIRTHYGEYDLDYEPFDIDRWCRDCGDTYLASCTKLSDIAKAHYVARGSDIVPLMCRYLSVSDLDELDTFEDLLIKLHRILYVPPVRYTDTFKWWCVTYCVSDMAAEHDRLMAHFNAKDDAELDTYLKLNMV